MEKERSMKNTILIVVVMLLVVVEVSAQTEREAGRDGEALDPWKPFNTLVGNWEGQIDGKLGTGNGVRRYEFIFGGKYLLLRHESVRLPQEKSPEGDQHQELGVFSYDRQRNVIVLREFMNEGVVVRSPCAVNDKKIVCASEEVESGPGIRSRLTLEIVDRYRFKEVYELAFPGRELEHYFTNHWVRMPVLNQEK